MLQTLNIREIAKLTQISIVAVHGLNGHREETWTTEGGVNWLKDLLPNDMPEARIMTWGYDARTHSNTNISLQNMFSHANTLVGDLVSKKKKTQVFWCPESVTMVLTAYRQSSDQSSLWPIAWEGLSLSR